MYDLKSLFFEREKLSNFELEVINKLDLYNEYMPDDKVVNAKEIESHFEEIKNDIKEKFEDFIIPID